MKTVTIKTTFILLSVLFFSCRQNTVQNKPISTRDTLLNDFIKMADSLPYYDTTNLNFKLLKAYKENDTSTLKEITSYVRGTSTVPWMHRYLKPCAINREFDTLTADEAYKFSYESSFCQYYTIATITQRGNSVKVNATVYKNATVMDSTPCTIVQQYETEIDSTSWVEFKRSIVEADFWGRMEDNEYHGVDGSSLDIQGYRKKFYWMRNTQSRRRYVSRWSESMNSQLEPFMMLLRLCKITKGCIHPG